MKRRKAGEDLKDGLGIILEDGQDVIYAWPGNGTVSFCRGEVVGFTPAMVRIKAARYGSKVSTFLVVPNRLVVI